MRRNKNLSKEEDLRERDQMVSLTAPAQSSGLCPYNLANVFCKIMCLEFYIIIIYNNNNQIRGDCGSRPSMILMMQGGIQNLGKPDDVVLEGSLSACE